MYDKNIIENALNDFYKSKGGDYLEKIVNIPLNLPLISNNVILNFFNYYLKEKYNFGIKFNFEFNKLISPFFKNLRKVKRFLKMFDIDYQMLNGYSLDFEDFLFIEILKMFEGELYDFIKYNKECFIKTSNTIKTYTMFSGKDKVVTNYKTSNEIVDKLFPESTEILKQDWDYDKIPYYGTNNNNNHINQISSFNKYFLDINTDEWTIYEINELKQYFNDFDKFKEQFELKCATKIEKSKTNNEKIESFELDLKFRFCEFIEKNNIFIKNLNIIIYLIIDIENYRYIYDYTDKYNCYFQKNEWLNRHNYFFIRMLDKGEILEYRELTENEKGQFDKFDENVPENYNTISFFKNGGKIIKNIREIFTSIKNNKNKLWFFVNFYYYCLFNKKIVDKNTIDEEFKNIISDILSIELDKLNDFGLDNYYEFLIEISDVSTYNRKDDKGRIIIEPIYCYDFLKYDKQIVLDFLNNLKFNYKVFTNRNRVDGNKNNRGIPYSIIIKLYLDYNRENIEKLYDFLSNVKDITDEQNDEQNGSSYGDSDIPKSQKLLKENKNPKTNKTLWNELLEYNNNLS